MLTYLNGPSEFGRAKKISLVKKLIEKAPQSKILKKVAAAPTVKHAGAHHKAMKAVHKSHPLAAHKIKKEAARKAKQSQFEDQGNPAVLDDQAVNVNPGLLTPNPQDTTDTASDTQPEVDFTEAPDGEDSAPVAEEDGGDLGVLFGTKRQNKKAEKKLKKANTTAQKKITKNKAKGQKPSNLRKTQRTAAKASKLIDTGAAKKNKGIAKTLKAQSGKGSALVSKLIDTGAGLLTKQTSGGADSELPDNLPSTPDATPDKKEAGIPKAVIYGGAALLAAGIAYMASRKHK